MLLLHERIIVIIRIGRGHIDRNLQQKSIRMLLGISDVPSYHHEGRLGFDMNQING